MPGTTCTTHETFTPKMRHGLPKRNANSLSRKYWSLRAVTGIGGMVPNITRRMTATSMNLPQAPAERVSHPRRRGTRLPFPSHCRSPGPRPISFTRLPTFIPTSRETWFATSSGLGQHATLPTIAPALCTANSFCLDAVYAGIDASNLYGRLDFTGKIPVTDFEIVMNVESWSSQSKQAERSLRLVSTVVSGVMVAWSVNVSGTDEIVASSADPTGKGIRLVVKRNFEFQMPLALLAADRSTHPSDGQSKMETNSINRLRVRFSLFRNHLPIDALPVEGWIELHIVSETELMAMA